MTSEMDSRPAFYRYCRRPGTRCNGIMELIDAGFSDEEIAKAVSSLPHKGRGMNPNIGCSAKTIRVYRKAHDNKLCKPSLYTFKQPDEARDRKIGEMHDGGMKPVKIAAELGVSIDIVRYALKRIAYRRDMDNLGLSGD